MCSQVYSCVLFLSNCGGPTAVLAQATGDGPAAEAWLVAPRAGRLAVFDGALLHGVIPGGASSSPSSSLSRPASPSGEGPPPRQECLHNYIVPVTMYTARRGWIVPQGAFFGVTLLTHCGAFCRRHWKQ